MRAAELNCPSVRLPIKEYYPECTHPGTELRGIVNSSKCQYRCGDFDSLHGFWKLERKSPTMYSAEKST